MAFCGSVGVTVFRRATAMSSRSADIPDEYRGVTDVEAKQRMLAAAVDACRAARDEAFAVKERANAALSQAWSEEISDEAVAQRERELEEKKALLRHWRHIDAVFFLLVFFAALTSSISLMETIVSLLRDKMGWGRRKACLVVFVGSLLLGVPSSMGFGALSNITVAGLTFLDMFDFISNSVLMPIVALLTCLFVGYVLKPKALIDEMEIGGKFSSKRLFTVVIKYVAPICIVLILISSVLDGLGIVKI